MGETYVQIEQIKSVLAERLTQFRDQNPDKHSYAYISNRTDVGPKYIERAAKNILGSEVDSKKVLELAKLVCDPKETQEIADFFAGRLLEESSILKDAIYAKFIKENERFVSSDFERVLLEDDSYVEYLLCCNTKGKTEEEVTKILGEKGSVALEKLKSRGLLVPQEGRLVSLHKKLSYTFEYIAKFIPILAKFYQPSHVGKERNYAHIVTTSLNREGIKRLQSEHRRHHEEVRKIRDEFEGDIDIFSVGFMDTFTSEDIDAATFNKSTKDKVMNGLSKTLMSLIVLMFSFSFTPKAIASEVVLEVKGAFKKALEKNFDSFIGPHSEIIKIKDLDLIRVQDLDGRFELDTGLTLDGEEFNFRDFTPVKRFVVGGDGSDGGGG